MAKFISSKLWDKQCSVKMAIVNQPAKYVRMVIATKLFTNIAQIEIRKEHNCLMEMSPIKVSTSNFEKKASQVICEKFSQNFEQKWIGN